MQGNNNNMQNQSDNNQNNNAVIIGELRKEKIGKPILVIEMFVVFVVVLISLPIVSSLLNDQNSFLSKALRTINPNKTTEEVIITDPIDEEEYLDAHELQQLSGTTKMKYDNLILDSFYLANDYIKVKISSYNGVLNLDEEPIFLEIYASTTNNLISSVKLTGTYDNQVKDVTLKANNLAFNSNYSYVGKVVKMEDGDYPTVNINSDESGIGTLTCTLDNQTIDYTFQNNYLIKIQDKVKVEFTTDEETTSYLNTKKSYEDKAEKLNDNASVVEVDDGFVYQAVIDLEKNEIPENLIDYNYYKFESEAKVIKYTLEGKGFDCK